jgi:DNA-binding response OmpR family regulator
LLKIIATAGGESVAYSVMIVEDDSAIRKELQALLERYGYEVKAAADFSRIVETALEERPHLILLDINLPYFDGFQICRKLREKSKIPVIMVTSRDSEMDELMSLNLGADHFVAKPYNPQILLAKISALLSRAYENEGSRMLRMGALQLDLGKSEASMGAETAELTRNEMRILQILLESNGTIVSRDQMMNALWQTDSFVDDNTLAVNVNRLRKKLQAIGAGDFLKTKRGMGYALAVQ